MTLPGVASSRGRNANGPGLDALQRGADLAARKRIPEAIAFYKRALRSLPDDARAHFELGELYAKLRHYPAALKSYRRALELEQHAVWHNHAGAVLAELGRADEAREAIERALTLDRGLAAAHCNLANLLDDAGDVAEAEASYRRSLELDPALSTAQQNLAALLARAGHFDEARGLLQAVLALNPASCGALSGLISIELRARRPQLALMACRRFRDARPGHSGALAFECVLLAELGRHREADRLKAHDEFVVSSELLGPPTPFASLREFNEALAGAILADDSLVESPASHATAQGRHSGELLVGNGGPVAALENVIGTAVQHYFRTLDQGSSHPFVAHRPGQVGLTAWAVILQRGGHQLPHIHPDAWLSGVYYVTVPQQSDADLQAGAGAIAFGIPDATLGFRACSETARYQPKTGMLLLFPSYLYHHTLPTAASDARISVAFDVVRAG
jgi:tetratricopeptide (TPR) repeat protein